MNKKVGGRIKFYWKERLLLTNAFDNNPDSIQLFNRLAANKEISVLSFDNALASKYSFKLEQIVAKFSPFFIAFQAQLSSELKL